MSELIGFLQEELDETEKDYDKQIQEFHEETYKEIAEL